MVSTWTYERYETADSPVWTTLMATTILSAFPGDVHRPSEFERSQAALSGSSVQASRIGSLGRRDSSSMARAVKHVNRWHGRAEVLDMLRIVPSDVLPPAR